MPAKKKAVVNASATLPINDTGNQLTQQLTDVANLQLSEEEKKKRRGRKPKDKFAFDDTTVNKPDSLTETDNTVIIKIPISCMEINKAFALSDSIPKPFDKNYNEIPASYQQQEGETSPSNMMPFTQTELPIQQNIQYNITHNESSIHELLADLIENNNKKPLTQVEILLEKKYKHTKQIGLLNNFCIGTDSKKWPESTQIACYWDCNTFNHTPWGIPTKYNYNTCEFTLFGVFCSPNCAMSYIMANEPNTNTLWERISLLNLLYYKIFETDENIIPAPDKLCLKTFGGILDIDEFRALTIKNNKIYNINFPPCHIITPVLEETKKIFNQDSYFIPNDKKKQNKIQTELKIKRTKSINANKNTLDNLLFQ